MKGKLVEETKIKYLGRKGIPATEFGAKHPDTGSWKVFEPRIDHGKCIKCHLCWLQCPDNAIKIIKEGRVAVDYGLCKGCGTCAEVCPVKCIKMVKSKKN